MRNVMRPLIAAALVLSAIIPVRSQDAPVAPHRSAQPGQPVMIKSWSDMPASQQERWRGKPCYGTKLDDERPIQFHRIALGGPLIVLVPCVSIVPHDEIWRVQSSVERLSLAVPSSGSTGGFATAPSLGILSWDDATNSLISTSTSDMIPDLAWRRTYVWSGEMILIKVESAMNRPYPYQWQTEWEAKPWRTLPKGPAASP